MGSSFYFFHVTKQIVCNAFNYICMRNLYHRFKNVFNNDTFLGRNLAQTKSSVYSLIMQKLWEILLSNTRHVLKANVYMLPTGSEGKFS